MRQATGRIKPEGAPDRQFLRTTAAQVDTGQCAAAPNAYGCSRPTLRQPLARQPERSRLRRPGAEPRAGAAGRRRDHVEGSCRDRPHLFLESGVASFHEILQDGSRVGVAIIGFEGLTGWPALLGIDRSPHEAAVAIGGGTALSITPGQLLHVCLERQAINAMLLRYVHCFISQMGRTILSNLHDSVEKRLARWLLMNHDRLEGDQIRLTHGQLAIMLGVRRATVTDALHLLEGEGMIRSTRGVIAVRDRARLLAVAGESYGAAETEYARFIAPFAK
jgi:CRP-like cAMP-binding protein